MSSSASDLEQMLAAALRRATPVDAARPAGAGGRLPDRAAAAAAATKSLMAAHRDRARAMDAYSATLASARSVADTTFSGPREELKELKEELRDLESQLSEAITLKLNKESRRKLAIESVSDDTARNEWIRGSIVDSTSKRDLRALNMSQELQALESLEAESNEDPEMAERTAKTFRWYDNFLGFWIVVAGEGVQFVFDKIDPQRPDKVYSLCVSPRLEFMGCDPHVKDIEELAKGLDLSVHLYQFVRMAREKFQSSSMNDVSAAPLPSPMVMPLNNRSEDAHNQTQSPCSSKKNVQLLPTKRGATPLSGASPGVLRRSPRLTGNADSSSRRKF